MKVIVFGASAMVEIPAIRRAARSERDVHDREAKLAPAVVGGKIEACAIGRVEERANLGNRKAEGKGAAVHVDERRLLRSARGLRSAATGRRLRRRRRAR